MEILSTQVESTFASELVLAIIVGVITIGVSYLLTHTTENKFGKLFFKLFFIFIVANNVYAWVTVNNRIYKYEISEAYVKDWNTVMNSDYEILERKGNWVKFKIVLDSNKN